MKQNGVMPLKIGIVGLPNAGKSTLFNALTESAQAEAENFPFCTIDSNVGRAVVRDNRLEQVAEVAKTNKIIHESVEFVDIAGLVEGASKGEGLGNKFLANIRETDAIALVLRFFSDPNVTHVLGEHNPQRDKEILETELILKDLETVEKSLAKSQKESKCGDKEKIAETAVLQKIYDVLAEGKKANSLDLDEQESKIAHHLHLLTGKKFLFIANVAEDEVANFDLVKARQNLQLDKNETLVAISAKIESELVLLDKNEREEFLNSLGLKQGGLDTLVREAYQILNLASYFTAGEKEARAWAFEKGSTAPQAAGKIHTDFEKGFIRADLVKWEDFIQHGGWTGAREKGAVQSVGKEHLVQDGDVLLFKFSN